MKVFLSWSGDISRSAAIAFREWLPSVIQNIEPYVSSEDIDKGTRWSSDISQELETSSYGILFVTRANLNASWLNFEAGALSKSIEKSRVSPFLLGIKRTEVRGPLLQFQSTVYERDDIKRLILTLNRADGIPFVEEGRLGSIFNIWWPELERVLNPLQEEAIKLKLSEEPEAHGAGTVPEMLEEVLELVRAQQKMLSTPELLLPPSYIDRFLGSKVSGDRTVPAERSVLIPRAMLDDIVNRWNIVHERLDTLSPDAHLVPSDVRAILEILNNPIGFMGRIASRPAAKPKTLQVSYPTPETRDDTESTE